MPDDIEQTLSIIIAASIFMLVLSLWIGGVLYWAMRRTARSQQVRRRLGSEEPRSAPTRTLHLWRGGKQASISAPVLKRRRSLLAAIERQCARAGWNHGAPAIILLMGGIATLGGGLTAFVTTNVILGLGVSIALLVLFRLYLMGRIARRDTLLETQLIDAMDLAARSLRAGHPLPGAFQLIAEETAPPVQTIFAELCQRQGMGASLEQSLRAVATSSPSADLRLFATSVAIQMRAGGNLADLLDRLSKVIRERMRLNRRIKVLTAQTQTSKRVLLMLPFLVFVVFNLINPDYMSPFYDTKAGHVLLGISIVALALGTLIMNRMAVLRY